MNAAIILYGFFHAGFFGLLIGLAAEEAKNRKHYVFLFCLAAAWPAIIVWKLCCEKEAEA